jgi:hypothetical protein
LLCPKVDILELARFVSANDHVQEKIDGNGTYTYFYESLSGRDLTAAPGKKLFELLRQDVSGLVAANGIVWRRWFQVHIDSIDRMLETIVGSVGIPTKAIHKLQGSQASQDDAMLVIETG